MSKEKWLTLFKEKLETAKQARGQFYTTQADHILSGLPPPPAGMRCVEPFAGKGDLLLWIRAQRPAAVIEAYDIEPKHPEVRRRDTLRHPPNYNGAWVVTNPPYLARNKSAQKDIYEMYDTNDLYRCFITSLTAQTPAGGILIIPSSFFLSSREADIRCRHDFMSGYRLTHVRYFENPAFDDTSSTIVAIAFLRSEPLSEQSVLWESVPSGAKRIFTVSERTSWVVAGEIGLLPTAPGVSFRRSVDGHPLRPGEQQTYLTLNAIDSGRATGRIEMTYRPGFVYPAKDSSRTYATMRITGRTLSESEQRRLCARFNEWVKKKREETWSLFLPQFRESKEYARKRITFELAYHILLHLLTEDLAEDLPEPADEENDAEKKKQPVAEVESKGDQTDGEK